METNRQRNTNIQSNGRTDYPEPVDRQIDMQSERQPERKLEKEL